MRTFLTALTALLILGGALTQACPGSQGPPGLHGPAGPSGTNQANTKWAKWVIVTPTSTGLVHDPWGAPFVSGEGSHGCPVGLQGHDGPPGHPVATTSDVTRPVPAPGSVAYRVAHGLGEPMIDQGPSWRPHRDTAALLQFVLTGRVPKYNGFVTKLADPGISPMSSPSMIGLPLQRRHQ